MVLKVLPRDVLIEQSPPITGELLNTLQIQLPATNDLFCCWTVEGAGLALNQPMRAKTFLAVYVVENVVLD